MPDVTLAITAQDIEAFARDGYLIRERIIGAETVAQLRAAMARSFDGDYDSGLMPDEVNWKPGHDPQVTRQICNVWKSNRALAAVILNRAVGQAAARLNGWPGAKLAQDNLLWKPPMRDGQPGGTLGMHQDSAYAAWAEPRLMCTVWIALDDVSAEGGTMEFARGSHLWGQSAPAGAFHNPADYKADFRRAAEAAGVAQPEMVPVEVPAGGGSIHHGWLWHGSGPNRTANPRRSVVSHCLSSEARFTGEVGYVYSRYKRLGTDAMDEAFFPVLWTGAGGRSSFVDPYIRGDLHWHGASSTTDSDCGDSGTAP